MRPDRSDGPPSGAFTPAEWRGSTFNEANGLIGVSFDTTEGPVRLLLTMESAVSCAESITDQVVEFFERTCSHAPSSCGIPNTDVSPHEGKNV